MSVIRPATLDDVDQLYPLVCAFMARAPVVLESDQDLVYESLLALCQMDTACVLVADAASHLEGFVIGHQIPYVLNPKLSVVQEQALFVAPPAQRRGIGGSLLAALETWSRAVGAGAVILSCFDGFPEIACMYDRRGYRAFEQHFVKEL